MNDLFKNIKLDEEKLKAISFYAEQKEMAFSMSDFIQNAMNSAIDKAYLKHVPKQVREYINRKD